MKKLIFLAVTFVFLGMHLFAGENPHKTPIKSLYAYELDNGLKLFVAENHSVPLTYIEIAVRCGSYTQNEENAGVFHLYEHMMFKGNSLYSDAAAVNKALSDMGVPDWNGTTDLECVNYFFTVPSDMTRKGLEFWNAAIRTPSMDKSEFENEKKVVISEINGYSTDPGRILYKSQNDLIFADAPYTMSPCGTEESVSKATLKMLKEMQKKYYIPNNSALFVGGDVDPDQVYEMVKEIYGSWKKGKDPFQQGVIRHSKEPFSRPEYRVMPYDKTSEQLATIIIEYRGPDAYYDRQDTYSADILSDLFSSPDGVFKQSLVNDPMIGVPDVDYVSGSYFTRKSCGVVEFWGGVVQPELDLPERAKYFAEAVEKVVSETAEKVTREQMDKIINRLEDSRIIESQTASGLLSTLRFWWCLCDEQYMFSYDDKMKEVSGKDLKNFVERYIQGKKPLVTVLVNPSIFEMTKENFEKEGFLEIKR